MGMGGPSDVTDEEVLRVLEEMDPPALPERPLAERIDMSAAGLNYRLETLRDRGLVDDYLTDNAHLWWITVDGKQFLEDEDEAAG